MKTKKCKQCGELKPEEAFRKYYGGRKGHYNTCRTCERINSRLKYLMSKQANLTSEERTEQEQILKLYQIQRKLGLQPPNTFVQPIPTRTLVDNLLAKYEDVGDLPEWVPMDLSKWLTAELTLDPDYYLDKVYEELVRKYRPVVRIDEQTLLPIYDDRYKEVLNKILDRFYNYETEYYKK
jgi:hypothetical protein